MRPRRERLRKMRPTHEIRTCPRCPLTGLARSKTLSQSAAMKKPREKSDYRLQGIGCALGELAHAQMEADLAPSVLDSLGISFDQLRNAGADPLDLKLLKPPKKPASE